MGLLYCPRFIATNNTTGAILPGARLYTFDSVSTTTPKATYSDNTLLVSNGAYVEADSLGVFPPIFGTSGEAYFMELRTSGGVVVDQFPFATILGADDTSVFLKDLGVNGRFQVSGSAGVVQLETGNAEGDDVGGSGRIGGYDGTQGDALELDYAAITATGTLDLTGALTVGGAATVTGAMTFGSTTSAWSNLSTGAITAASTVDIPLSSALNAYRLELYYIEPAAALTINAQFAFDSTPTFKSGASDYLWHRNTISEAGTVAGASDLSDPSIRIVTYSAAFFGGYSRLTIDIDSRAGKETVLFYDGINAGDGLGLVNSQRVLGSGATNSKGYGKATYIRLTTTASTITARYVLTGKTGF